jgi:Ubiquitin fusion degradation protein UFD1
MIHCGVLEFTAPQNAVYMPKWMLEHLAVEPGKKVTMKLTPKLPKATFVQFRPKEYAFTQMADPKQTYVSIIYCRLPCHVPYVIDRL